MRIKYRGDLCPNANHCNRSSLPVSVRLAVEISQVVDTMTTTGYLIKSDDSKCVIVGSGLLA